MAGNWLNKRRKRMPDRRSRRPTYWTGVETLEPRMLLSFDPVGNAFVHNDPMLGVDQSQTRVAALPSAVADTFVTVFPGAGR